MDMKALLGYGYGMSGWQVSPYGNERLGFRVSYGGERADRTVVTASTGYGTVLPDEDYQSVELNDPRLTFTARGEFADGLQLVHLQLSKRPDGPSITQGSLRQAGIIAELRTWARVARRMQHGVVDEGLRGLLEFDLPSDTDLHQAVTASEDRVDRWLKKSPKPSKRRKSREEAEATLRRVVDRYKALVALGDPSPRLTIAAEEHYTPEHIGRLLVKARNRKPPLLGPAAPGKAGETKDAK